MCGPEACTHLRGIGGGIQAGAPTFEAWSDSRPILEPRLAHLEAVGRLMLRACSCVGHLRGCDKSPSPRLTIAGGACDPRAS